MGKSHQKNRKDGIFMTYICHFSNKKDKKIAHKKLRAKTLDSLSKLYKEQPKNSDIFFYEYLNEKINFPEKLKEVSDTYNFSSDGLKHFITFNELRSQYFIRNKYLKSAYKEFDIMIKKMIKK